MVKPISVPEKFLFYASTILSTILIFQSIFRWFLIEKLSLIENILELCVIGLFLIIFIGSVFYFFEKRYYIPFIINLVGIIFFYIFTFTDAPIHLHFSLSSDEYEKIAEMIIAENEWENIDRPLKDQRIQIQKKGATTKILFVTIRGFIDGFAGFVYTSDNNPPQQQDFWCGQFVELKKIKQNWFWISCT